jgi:hypothetical protein
VVAGPPVPQRVLVRFRLLNDNDVPAKKAVRGLRAARRTRERFVDKRRLL